MSNQVDARTQSFTFTAYSAIVFTWNHELELVEWVSEEGVACNRSYEATYVTTCIRDNTWRVIDMITKAPYKDDGITDEQMDSLVLLMEKVYHTLDDFGVDSSSEYSFGICEDGVLAAMNGIRRIRKERIQILKDDADMADWDAAARIYS